jgi:hypothetical protein
MTGAAQLHYPDRKTNMLNTRQTATLQNLSAYDRNAAFRCMRELEKIGVPYQAAIDFVVNALADREQARDTVYGSSRMSAMPTNCPVCGNLRGFGPAACYCEAR